jgi:hypothetical protein
VVSGEWRLGIGNSVAAAREPHMWVASGDARIFHSSRRRSCRRLDGAQSAT